MLKHALKHIVLKKKLHVNSLMLVGICLADIQNVIIQVRPIRGAEIHY